MAAASARKNVSSMVAGWFNADHREGPATRSGIARQGRVAQSVMKGRTITNVTGAYNSTRSATHRSPAEPTLWMAQTWQAGWSLWIHWLGERLRTPLARWAIPLHLARSQEAFSESPSIRPGSAYPQIRLPSTSPPVERLPGGSLRAARGEILFDFVHQDDPPETLGRYRALLIPNAAATYKQ